MEMTAMENYNNVQLVLVTYQSQEQSRHEIPVSFFNFPFKKVFLLYVCKLTRKKNNCKGVSMVNETLTHSNCRCWEAGAHLKSNTFRSELLSALDAICRAARHTAPASCAGSACPGLLMAGKPATRLSCPCHQLRKCTVQGGCNLEQHTL